MSVMITGSPGVGKRTVADVLADTLGLELVNVNDVARKADLINPEGAVDVDELGLKLKDMAGNDKLIIGHLAPYALRAEQVSSAIVLRRSPYSLEGVYEKRNYTRAKSLANLGAEILGIVAHDTVEKFGKSATHQIDNTSREPKDTAALVCQALDSKYTEDSIDWLSEVREQGDMQRFFSY